MPDPQYTLDDLRRQLHQISRLGSLGEIMKMIPGLSGLAERLGSIDPEHELRVIDAIINSMTPAERAEPDPSKPAAASESLAAAARGPRTSRSSSKISEPCGSSCRRSPA